ncbi:hypothetical protein BH10PSE17_BH10PSE17_28130 [soil metagenome]
METSERRSRQRKALVAASLGQALVGWIASIWLLAMGTALGQLSGRIDLLELRGNAAVIVALQLAATGVGGIVGGILADRLGRVRVLVAALLALGLAAVLSGFVRDVPTLRAAAVLIGLSIGSMWAAAAALVAETFSDGRRGISAGVVTAASSIGALVALFVWMRVGPMSSNAWRVMFGSAVVLAWPLALWIGRAVVEPRRSRATLLARRAAVSHRSEGRTLAEDELRLLRFPLASAFMGRSRFERSVAAVLLSIAAVTLWWTISYNASTLIGSIARSQGRDIGRWALGALATISAGAALGSIAFGWFADRRGRSKATLVALAASLPVALMMLYLTRWAPPQLVLAFLAALAAGGLPAWQMAWLPELYSTRMRGSMLGLAHGLPRLLLAALPVPLVSAAERFDARPAALLIGVACLVGFAAAWRLPETRRHALPA